jgi:hypothetical protein
VISLDQCDQMVSDWHETHYQPFPFNQSNGFFESWPFGPPVDFPHCNASGADFVLWENDTSLYTDGSGCWIKGGEAQLFYWPEPVQEQNQSCPQTWTIPPEASESNTAIVTTIVTIYDRVYNTTPQTVTMTSPTMYLAVTDLEARAATWGFAGDGPIPREYTSRH